MSSYLAFAEFYDYLTENVNYKVRSEYISNFFYKYGKKNCSLLDLACGTGTFSKFFDEMGYDVTALDLSAEMLAQASSKCSDSVKFLKGDMTSFSLENKVDCCICTLDSINHLDDIDKVRECFSSVADNMNKDGIFIFDVNTVYKHEAVLGDNAFVFDEENFFLSWDNEYMGDGVVRILLDFFVLNGESYDRYSEEFFEKAYEIEEMKFALDDFEILGIYDEFTQNPPATQSERLYFVCKRK